MSNIYVTEPNTEGKVIMKTSFGELDIEFWPQQAPKACRNFFQLAMEKYYDNTLFHRLISGFMIQGGDPTGTGNGGESIYGQPFSDEFHSRLRFNHRGIIGMANSNRPDTNSSQFFFTLDSCDFLTKKNTIFGKITGNTIFNLLTVNDMDTSKEERPIDPIKLLNIEILWNPFQDIIPRNIKLKNLNQLKEKKLNKRKEIKNIKLLSFGDETIEDFILPIKKKKGSLSSHDILHDSKLSREINLQLKNKIDALPMDKNELNQEIHENNDLGSIATIPLNTLKARISEKLKKKSTNVHTNAKPRVYDAFTEIQVDMEDSVNEMENEKKKKKKKKDEYTLLKEEMKKTHRAAGILKGDKLKAAEAEKAYHEMLTPLQLRREKYLKLKKSNLAQRQKHTLNRLETFKNTLTNVIEKKKKIPIQEEIKKEFYHGQILSEDSDQEEDPNDQSWMTAKLKFKKHIDDQYRMGYDPNADNYMTIDPKKNIK